jgi:hypothetical protein
MLPISDMLFNGVNFQYQPFYTSGFDTSGVIANSSSLSIRTIEQTTRGNYSNNPNDE